MLYSIKTIYNDKYRPLLYFKVTSNKLFMAYNVYSIDRKRFLRTEIYIHEFAADSLNKPEQLALQ